MEVFWLLDFGFVWFGTFWEDFEVLCAWFLFLLVDLWGFFEVSDTIFHLYFFIY